MGLEENQLTDTPKAKPFEGFYRLSVLFMFSGIILFISSLFILLGDSIKPLMDGLIMAGSAISLLWIGMLGEVIVDIARSLQRLKPEHDRFDEKR